MAKKLQFKTEGLTGEPLAVAEKLNIALNGIEVVTDDEVKGAIDAAFAKAFGTEAGGELKLDWLKELDGNNEASMKSAVVKQGNAINTILQKLQNGEGGETNMDKFETEFKAALPELKQIAQNQSGSKAFTIKAAATTTTSSSVSNNGTLSGILGDGPVFNLQRGLPFVLQFVTVTNTDQPVLVWFDEQPRQGNFAITAEGTVKPLVQYIYVRSTTDKKKVAGRTVITEEFMQDYPRLVSNIRNLMQIDCKNAMTAAILTNMVANASPYTSTALTGQIYTPDNYAAIGAAIAQLQSLFYIPNILVLNPADAWVMRLTKDAQGRYQMNPLLGRDMNYEFGTIIVDPRVAPGYAFVGDGTIYNVALYGDIIVRMGYSTGDFEANQMTLLVEQYYFDYVSTARKPGFIYFNFAAVKAAIAHA